jgi:predicted nucleic acid-binding protein
MTVPWAPNFVLDVSVPLTWILTHLATGYTTRVLGRMTTSAAIVPGNWPYELAGEVLKAERAGLKTEPEVTRFFTGFGYFRLFIDTRSAVDTWADIVPKARAHRLRPTTAAYIELALRLSLPLATIDRKLSRAAVTAGIPIFTP